MVNSDLRFGPNPRLFEEGIKKSKEVADKVMNELKSSITAGERVDLYYTYLNKIVEDHSKYYVVTMPDGEQWGVPIRIIIEDRFKYFFDSVAPSFWNDKDQLKIELNDLVDEHNHLSAFEIEDWARNNMNWKDVEKYARFFQGGKPADRQEGWLNGESEFVDI